MIINGKIVSDYDWRMKRERRRKQARHRYQGYPGEYRLVMGDRVFDHERKYNFGYPRPLLFTFYQHLYQAIRHPQEFVFEGCGCKHYGREGAARWLENHRQRLNLPAFAGSIRLLLPDDTILLEFTIPQD